MPPPTLNSEEPRNSLSPSTYTVLGNSYGKAINNPYQTLENPKETVTPVYKDVERTIVDDAAVAMLGISRIVNLKNEIEELKVFIKVLNRLA